MMSRKNFIVRVEFVSLEEEVIDGLADGFPVEVSVVRELGGHRNDQLFVGQKRPKFGQKRGNVIRIDYGFGAGFGPRNIDSIKIVFFDELKNGINSTALKNVNLLG